MWRRLFLPFWKKKITPPPAPPRPIPLTLQRRVPENLSEGSHCLKKLFLTLSPKGEFLRTVRTSPRVPIVRRRFFLPYWKRKNWPPYDLLHLLDGCVGVRGSGWVIEWVGGWAYLPFRIFLEKTQGFWFGFFYNSLVIRGNDFYFFSVSKNQK